MRPRSKYYNVDTERINNFKEDKVATNIQKQNLYAEEENYCEFFNPNSNTNQKNFHIKGQNTSVMNNTHVRFQEAEGNNNFRYTFNNDRQKLKNKQRNVMKNNLSPSNMTNCFKQGGHNENDAKSVLSGSEMNTNVNQQIQVDKKKSKGLRVRTHINSQVNVNNNYHLSNNKIKKLQSKRDQTIYDNTWKENPKSKERRLKSQDRKTHLNERYNVVENSEEKKELKNCASGSLSRGPNKNQDRNKSIGNTKYNNKQPNTKRVMFKGTRITRIEPALIYNQRNNEKQNNNQGFEIQPDADALLDSENFQNNNAPNPINNINVNKRPVSTRSNNYKIHKKESSNHFQFFNKQNGSNPQIVDTINFGNIPEETKFTSSKSPRNLTNAKSKSQERWTAINKGVVTSNERSSNERLFPVGNNERSSNERGFPVVEHERCNSQSVEKTDRFSQVLVSKNPNISMPEIPKEVYKVSS